MVSQLRGEGWGGGSGCCQSTEGRSLRRRLRLWAVSCGEEAVEEAQAVDSQLRGGAGEEGQAVGSHLY